MIMLIAVGSIAIAALSGLLVKHLVCKYSRCKEITNREFTIGLAVISIVVVPLVIWSGYALSIHSKLTYNEYWNGWETAAQKEEVICTRDGACHYDYDCDPYIVMVPYSCNCTKDGCSTCLRPETRYHSCPYVTKETNYYVDTTLDRYEISLHRFPSNPQAYRWRESVTIPDSVISSAQTGIPPFWQEVKNRLTKKEPGPVTKRYPYENYILASEKTILKQYSTDIAKFQAANILPPPQFSVYDFYRADKVYFVACPINNTREWQNALSYLNADLGTSQQADVHLVLIKSELASQNPDAYTLSLKAYWQNNKIFKRNAFSKNGICVVIGTDDGKTVAWARAFTGMPLGNEALTVAIRNELKGRPLEPQELIGGKFYKERKTQGWIEATVKGTNDRATRFRRVSMSGQSAGHNGAGFLYLKSEIQPTANEQLCIFLIVFVLTGVVWTIMAVYGDNFYKRR